MFELLTNAEMGEADRATIASGVSGESLMEAAGAAVARAVIGRYPPGGNVVVIAGTGNNGGDGFVAARHLREAGFTVEVVVVGAAENIKGDAAEAAQRWGQWSTPAGDAPDFTGATLIIDALLGAGLDRPVTGAPLLAIDAMNKASCPIVAIDLPSGISGTTGAIMGGAAVRATRTVTFFRKKPGHLLLPGRMHCGALEVAQIGIGAEVLPRIKPLAFENSPALWGSQFPVPAMDGHKYNRGHAVVVSGALAYTGAARLAAMGALRAGAGLVTIASPRDALSVNAASSLAVMVRPVEAAVELEHFLKDPRFNAVGIGPGAGVTLRTRDMTLMALAGERSVVVDADALVSFADHADTLFAALAQNRNGVLTPHAGEFAKLFGKTMEQIPASSASKLLAARAASGRSGAVVVYKGADTVIASPDGRAAINANAPPWLATAGSGDVLTGLITGLLAQGMPPFEAAAAAVWIHGEAATAAGPGMISEDLAPRLPEVYRRLFADLLRD